jgi:glycosyltransferase involved in cell wall biosynthesis
LRVEENVTFHGGYDWENVGECIQAVHVGLITSLCEGFGLVILEMLSRGRPVIASDVGSCREVLEELGGGWVFPNRDLDALVGRMKVLCDAPKMIEETGKNGRRIWLENFTPEMMFERYRKFWSECGADS